jgi:hypothetical protein
VGGSIDLVVEMEAYTFTGAAGDIARVRIGDGSGCCLEGRVEIFDPSGVSIAAAQGSESTHVDVTLERSGTFLVLATDEAGNDTGGYSLSLQRLNGPTGAVQLSYGSTVNGSIDLVAEMDAYSFSGTAGDLVRIQIGDGSGCCLEGRVEIFDPSGTSIGAAQGSESTHLDLALQRTGSFLILATDEAGNDTGGYSLSLEVLN